MKKYTDEQLEEALTHLNGVQNNSVIDEFKLKLLKEVEKRNKPKFTKATNEYLETLGRDDVYTRILNENDIHFYPGMYGLFEKGTDKLLRRHTDTGFLLLPCVKREVFG